MKVDDNFARVMIKWHLRMALKWALDLSEECTLDERDYLTLEFRNQCDNAVSKLQAKNIVARKSAIAS